MRASALKKTIILIILLTAALAKPQENQGGNTVHVYTLGTDPERPSLYKIEFTLADTLHADAVMILTFPSDFNLSELEIIGSTTINGGLSMTVDEQTVHVERKVLGDPVVPGKKVDFKIGLIRPSGSLNTTGIIDVQIIPSLRKNIKLSIKTEIELK